MSAGLFRQEALDAQRSSGLGGISLLQPLRLRLMTLAAIAIAVVVVLFLSFGSYTRRARVAGQLVPTQGLATLVAPTSGVLEQLSVAEGDRVRAGQVLGLVRVPRATLSGSTVDALERGLDRRRDGLSQTQAAQAQRLAVQEQGLRAQLTDARRELEQVEAEAATRQEQSRIAGETLARLRELGRKRFASDLQIKQQEASALEHVASAQSLRRQALTAQRLMGQLEQALAELPTQQASAEADYRRELAALEQERVQVQAGGEAVVTAPVDGIVATRVAKAGQAVQAGQALLSVLPADGELEAELLVPSRAIGFIAPGDEVLLRYQAFPYQKFGHHPGRVARITRSALSPGELGALIGQTAANEPLYRITVALASQTITAYGEPEALKPGMLLDADILGERRRLIEWVFEPLYSLMGQMGAP